MPDRGLAAALEGVLLKVRSGSSLSDALAAEPRYFPPLYVSLVRAGEASGRLGRSLGELATMREQTEALRSKLTSALIYPIVLLLTAIGAVVVLLTVVVPRMEPMFAQAGAALPASTRVVLAATDLLREQGYLLLALLAAAAAARRAAAAPTGAAPRRRRLAAAPAVAGPAAARPHHRPALPRRSPPASAAASTCRRRWWSAATSWATSTPGPRWTRWSPACAPAAPSPTA